MDISLKSNHLTKNVFFFAHSTLPIPLKLNTEHDNLYLVEITLFSSDFIWIKLNFLHIFCHHCAKVDHDQGWSFFHIKILNLNHIEIWLAEDFFYITCEIKIDKLTLSVFIGNWMQSHWWRDNNIVHYQHLMLILINYQNIMEF